MYISTCLGTLAPEQLFIVFIFFVYVFVCYYEVARLRLLFIVVKIFFLKKITNSKTYGHQLCKNFWWWS